MSKSNRILFPSLLPNQKSCFEEQPLTCIMHVLWYVEYATDWATISNMVSKIGKNNTICTGTDHKRRSFSLLVGVQKSPSHDATRTRDVLGEALCQSWPSLPVRTVSVRVSHVSSRSPLPKLFLLFCFVFISCYFLFFFPTCQSPPNTMGLRRVPAGEGLPTVWPHQRVGTENRVGVGGWGVKHSNPSPGSQWLSSSVVSGSGVPPEGLLAQCCCCCRRCYSAPFHL